MQGTPRSNSAAKAYDCPICDRSCENNVLLGRHLEHYHAEDSDLEEAITGIHVVSTDFPVTRSDRHSIATPCDLQQHSQLNCIHDARVLHDHHAPLSYLQIAENGNCPSYHSDDPGCNGDIRMNNSTCSQVEKGNMAFSVMQFYSGFNENPKELYPNLSKIDPPLSGLSQSITQVLKYCTTNQLSIGEASNLFDLLDIL